MKSLEKRNPSIKKAISELKNISRSSRSRELYEARRKAELDYNSGMMGAYRKGLQEGIEQGTEKGIEGFYLGIQLNLEVRFNVKDNLLMQRVRKIKDIEKLKKVLIASAKSKSLTEFKKSLK